MKKVFSTLYAVFLIISVSIINSCASVNKVADSITIESGQIPPDMRTEDFTLIGVLQGRKSYDKYVEKEFNEYQGKYVLATYEQIKTTYNDPVKYRYILNCTIGADQFYEPNSPGSNHQGYTTVTAYKYYILDRKDDKKYVRKHGSSFFALEIKAYLEAIDDIRKK